MNLEQIDHYFLMRRKKGLKLTDMAKYIGCSQPLLSKFERGQCNMSDEKIKKYREYIEQK